MRNPVQLVLAVACVLVAVSAPAASAASCTSGTTSWQNPNGGAWGNAANWDNGVPSADCDARIALPGDYGVAVGTTAGSAGAARSVSIGGGDGGGQTLVSESDGCTAPCSAGTLNVGAGGIRVVDHGSLKLTQGFVDVAGSVELAGGTLRGSGQLTASGGVHNSSGRVVIDPDSVLGIVGDFSQAAAGTFVVLAQPKGAQSRTGVMTVSGTPTLGGLFFAFGSGPGQSQEYVLQSLHEVQGTFAKISYADQPYDASYWNYGVGLAAACVTGTTYWINPDGGAWYDPDNWSNGRPTIGCNARITLPGNYSVTVDHNAGAGLARSVTIGGAGGHQRLWANNYGSSRGNERGDTLNVAGGGITVRRHGSIHMLVGHLDVTGRVTLAGGLLAGSGDIVADGGVYNTSGTVSLPVNFNSADLRIHGAYVQGPRGTLAVGIGPACGRGTESGYLSAAFGIRLAGRLKIDARRGSVAHCEVIHTRSGRTGAFSFVQVTHRPYNVLYDLHTGSVFVRARR